MIVSGKQYIFYRVNGLINITGYVLLEDNDWISVKDSDARPPIILNKAFIGSYREVDA